MKPFLLFLLVSSRVCVGQTIDSVVVKHCTYIEDFTDTTFEISVDSFDVSDLLINSFSYDTNWNVTGREIFTYSVSNLFLNKITQSYDTSTWTNRLEIINEYDLNDSLIESFDYRYNYYLGVLTDTTGYRDSYSHDTLIHSSTWKRFHYSDSTNSWLTDIVVISYYDSLNRKTLQVRESGSFTVTDSTWFFYLANDSLDYFIIKQNPYQPPDKIQHFYNLQDFLVKVIDSTWNISTQTWHPDWQQQYYRDVNNNVIGYSQHYYIDTLGTLDPAGDTSAFQYNSLNQEIYEWTQFYSFGGNISNSAYDSIGILQHYDYCSWGHGGDQHCHDCDYDYFTYPFTTGIQAESQQSRIIIYPNPSSKSFWIKNIPTNKTTLIQVLNTLGEIVYSETLFGKNECMVHMNFSKGIYFVSVVDGEMNTINKLIIE